MKKLSLQLESGYCRLNSPAATLQRIQPMLAKCGITRYADITGLDEIGIPTYAAIRPRALVLQVSNGKGVTADAAKVSALMEAIEVDHAERPLREKLRWASAEELEAAGENYYDPQKLEMRSDVYWEAGYKIPWTLGENILTREQVWFPGNYIYFDLEPVQFQTSSNGLASGNHRLEADLHALYELIERDAVSGAFRNFKLKVLKHWTVIDPSSVDEPPLSDLIARVNRAGIRLLLIHIHYGMPIHTFWALLVNESSFSPVSALNYGYGTHLDPLVAACRAVTEAAQSRLTFIHGCREDLLEKKSFRAVNVEDSRAFTFFRNLHADRNWSDFRDCGDEQIEDLVECHDHVVSLVQKAGKGPVYRFDLERPEIGIPVVRLVAPSLGINSRLF